ncbi:hypothetical protein TNCV_1761171 [Trichonephila clavipes]|nr:hypothetical protein TNCV_1761171 [Trichonephila clavipes]
MKFDFQLKKDKDDRHSVTAVSMNTMSQRSHLTDSEAWRDVGRLEGGQTQDEVAQAIGVSQSVMECLNAKRRSLFSVNGS